MKSTFSVLVGITILAGLHASVCSATDVHEPSASQMKSISDTLSLNESAVSAHFANVSRSSLRLVTVSDEQLRLRGASKTYPELLRGIPSLYATSQSGSYGDARLNIRGFGQENIAVLLNGIPISGLVSSGMYWNNWMGLADATFAVQVQKGVGASMLSDGSVGGSVEIVTESPSDEFTAEAGFYGSAYGRPSPGNGPVAAGGPYKGYLKLSSGALPHGWAMNLMVSYVGGGGYVEATDVDSWAYMLNVSKTFGTEHRLVFVALGSPENHGQRTSRLSADEVSRYGTAYNKDWGLRDGKVLSLSHNSYFKPYFTLQHFWDGERISMKNSVYLAIGNGGGQWSESKGRGIASFVTEDGHIDWEAAISANRAPNGTANNILSLYMAGHTQVGAISTLTYELSPHWKIGAGVHGQYYGTWECERITDLLGADWWFEDYESKSLAGTAGRESVKGVGDYIRTDNGKRTLYGSAYATVSYNSTKVSADLGASVFAGANRRWDKYNYVGEDVLSDVASGVGASVKGGVLYRAGRGHSLYVNGGWYSRLPQSSVWFASGNNEITRGVKNERNLLGEAGWRAVWESGSFELTGYAALWKNRSLMSGKYRRLDDGETRFMATGLDAVHCGVEASIFQRIGRWMELKGFASLGNWKWKNDVSAVLYDDYTGMEAARVNVYCDGLPVADAPQTQLGANVKFLITGGFALSADWQFNDRMYADFDPLTRSNPDDRQPSYRIPGYHLLGAGLSWSGSLGHGRRWGKAPVLNVFLRGDNLLDTLYIERGRDGAGHDLSSFRGFWGFGRNFSFGLRIRI